MDSEINKMRQQKITTVMLGRVDKLNPDSDAGKQANDVPCLILIRSRQANA